MVYGMEQFLVALAFSVVLAKRSPVIDSGGFAFVLGLTQAATGILAPPGNPAASQPPSTVAALKPLAHRSAMRACSSKVLL